MNIDIFQVINKFLNNTKKLITKLQKKLDSFRVAKKGKVIPIDKKGRPIKKSSRYSKYYNIFWYIVGAIILYYLFPIILYLISFLLSVITVLLIVFLGWLFLIGSGRRR